MSRVIVVGAGPAGATLAYLLARRGTETLLVERQHDFAREFRGEVLFPGGMEPFRQMGLGEALDAVPHVELKAAEIHIRGRQPIRADFDLAAFGGTLPRWTSQPALLEMLVAQASAHPHFRLERGIRVREVIEDDGRVVGVELQDGRREQADLVVGADGRTSLVRRRSQIPVDEDSVPMDVVWCKLPQPSYLDSDPHIRAYVGGGHLLIAAPTYDDRMQIAWIIEKGRYGDVRAEGMPACLDEMAQHVSGDLAEHIRAHREDSIQPFLLSTVSDRVRHWSKPGMLLIGDAAHTMSPVGAQGLNIAIRDAVVAANRLVPVLEGEAGQEAIDAAAQAIEAERIPEVAWIQRMQARAPPVILRDTWWTRLLLGVVPRLLASDIARARRGNVFRRVAFGVTDVSVAV